MKQNLYQTKTGLPNTCWSCGEHPGSHWFVAHEDAARSGAGLCGRCANVVTDPAEPGADGVTNDLTAIRGVGAKRAVEFATLGIQTFAQLAQTDAAILAVQLNAKPEDVARWQSEALRLAEAK